ncbi:MAG: hypothetical protein L0K40_09735, partial [Tetragenococcus halophilus]|nr:hypothetical protein [Tetragenococcus halophilus]
HIYFLLIFILIDEKARFIANSCLFCNKKSPSIMIILGRLFSRFHLFLDTKIVSLINYNGATAFVSTKVSKVVRPWVAFRKVSAWLFLSYKSRTSSVVFFINHLWPYLTTSQNILQVLSGNFSLIKSIKSYAYTFIS